MRRPAPKPIRPPVPVIPGEISGGILSWIRRQFYQDDKRFFQDRAFLLERVVLWPASWLSERSLRMAPDLYKAKLMEILLTVARHGQTGAVQYWPGYLAAAVQSHFKIHEEEIRSQCQSLDIAVAQVLTGLGRLPAGRPDPVEAMAQARDILRTGRHRHSSGSSGARQLPLL